MVVVAVVAIAVQCNLFAGFGVFFKGLPLGSSYTGVVTRPW